MQPVLVTGATGRVGRAVVAELVGTGGLVQRKGAGDADSEFAVVREGSDGVQIAAIGFDQNAGHAQTTPRRLPDRRQVRGGRHADERAAVPKSWQQLMQNAMAQDFSWTRQIVQYDSLYREMLGTVHKR